MFGRPAEGWTPDIIRIGFYVFIMMNKIMLVFSFIIRSLTVYPYRTVIIA